MVIINGTTPGTQIGLDGDNNANSGGVTFDISFSGIREVNREDSIIIITIIILLKLLYNSLYVYDSSVDFVTEIVRTYDLHLQNISFSLFNSSYAAKAAHHYIIILPNNAKINVSLIISKIVLVVFDFVRFRFSSLNMKFPFPSPIKPFT